MRGVIATHCRELVLASLTLGSIKDRLTTKEFRGLDRPSVGDLIDGAELG
jgi:hypothetical protein